MSPQNHVRFIIGCIAWLATISALAGAWLLWKGFAGGGELVMTVNTAIAGMIGFLSNRQPPPPPGPNDPPAPVTVTNTERDPVPTTNQTNP
jgi:hypothetical protein